MTEPRTQRRLAAIMAADIVGYSRLVEADEAGTLARVRALRAELLHPKVAQYGGRIVKTTGDGTLVEFPSAVEAVNHALNVQAEMAHRNAGEPESSRILLRIGINVGDIVVEGDDIHGDGVNVAARVEALAEPGGIAISGAAYDHVTGKVVASFDDLGPQMVKNISRPIRVLRVRAAEASSLSQSTAGQTTAEPFPLPDRPSIAVLPFENMSGDPDQEYFADGMAEDIITALSRFRWFFVIARNSSFTYKGKVVDVRHVGRELGVRYVLEGSVRKGGNLLRITAQLVDAETGNHIWADKYDGAPEDVFDLQDRITEGVVGAIDPSIREAEIERARRKRPDNLGAYDRVLRAMPYVRSQSPREALAPLEEALKLDPDYGLAHSLCASCYEQLYVHGGSRADSEAAVRHARATFASRTDDSYALASAAFIVSIIDRDHEMARRGVERAIESTPNSAYVYARQAWINNFAGDFAAAVSSAEHAVLLAPRDPTRYLSESAWATACFLIGQYDVCNDRAHAAIHANPRFIWTHAILAASYVRLGRPDAARAALKQLREIEPTFTPAHFSRIGFSDPAHVDAIISALREAGLPE